jgi:beta-fructofuranosidase
LLFVPTKMKDHQLWDSWLFKKNRRYHLYHLLKREGERSSYINHAVSDDLFNWTDLGPIIQRGAAGSWDSGPLMTGTTVEYQGKYYMFYGSKTDGVQRIGLAVSDDLENWVKYGSKAVLEVDSRWYAGQCIDKSESGVAWRDPHIRQDENGRFHVFLCARAKTGSWCGRGAIAHAVSDNLLDWEVTEPVYVSDKYGFLEVPDLFQLERKWYILFSTGQWHSARTKDSEYAASGIRYLVGQSMLGPYREPEESSLLSTREDLLGAYVGRTLPEPVFLEGGKEAGLFYYHNVFPNQARNFKNFKGSWASPKYLMAENDRLSLRCYPGMNEALRVNNRDHQEPVSLTITRQYPGNSGTGICWRQVSADSTHGKCPGGAGISWSDVVNSDGIWKTSIKIENGRAAGLLFRYNHQDGHGYSFALNPERQRAELLEVTKAEFGVMLNVFQYRPLTVKLDRNYCLKIIARDHFVDAYVDEVLLFSLPVARRQGQSGFLLDGSVAVFTGTNFLPIKPLVTK